MEKRRRLRIRQSDVTRAVKGAKAAGIEISKVEIDPATGKIMITPTDVSAPDLESELDKWRAKHARSA